MIASLFEGFPGWTAGALAIGIVLVIAAILAEAIARATRALSRPLLHDRSVPFGSTPLLRPIRLVRVAIFLLIAGALLSPALQFAGVQTHIGWSHEELARWFLESGLRIGFIALLAYIIIRIADFLVVRLEQDLKAEDDFDYLERAKRVRTLGSLIKNTLAVFVVSIATLMILKELRLDITPVLTGAGIAGLAVGFGAQTLVKDIISGFFLILENQVRVGDVAQINGTGGLVEAITLRTITLRDDAGTVHVFPNGSITTLSNLSKDFSYYVINLGVAYDEDTDRVTGVLREIGDELRQDARLGPWILAPIDILGIENFGDSQILMKLRIKTLPLKQWEVGRELRRRIKIRFDKEGIEMPFRQLTLHVTNPPPELTGKPPGDTAPPSASAPSAPAQSARADAP